MKKSKKIKLFWSIVPVYMLLVILTFSGLTLYFYQTCKIYYVKNLKMDLSVLSTLLNAEIFDVNSFSKQKNMKAYHKLPYTFTYYDHQGNVVFDTNKVDHFLDNKAIKQEIERTFKEEQYIQIKNSKFFKERVVIITMLHKVNNQIKGIIRLVTPLSNMKADMKAFKMRIIIIIFIATLLFIIITLYISRKTVKPIEELTACTMDLTKGNYQVKLPEAKTMEIDKLVIAIKKMSEGINRNISRLNKLERMRKEFVANVSHELKTPITLIRGFSETLINESENVAPHMLKHLTIINKHSERINMIIEDLLTLSKIEQDESIAIPMEKTHIRPLIYKAIEACSIKIIEKNIKVEVDCEVDLMAEINILQIEQAMINLLENAIKYSKEDKEILIRAKKKGQKFEIMVKDQGYGIEAKHLPLLFQRFYRVDKARSRDMGGTGLGLAIVKHIAQAHGGSVYVESEVDVGSVFYIRLPV
jgi:signal transduction histidine kinase